MIEPPRLFESLLRRALPHGADWQSILGDLREDFVHLARLRGARWARRWYRRQAVQLTLQYGHRRLGASFAGPRGQTMTGLVRDELRDAWRGLRSGRGTTLLALVVLTVGIAAATVTFSVVDTIALRRLPFPEAGRLVAIAQSDGTTSTLGPVAPQDFFTWQEQVQAFEGLAAAGPLGGLSLTTDGGATERLVASRITSNLFDVLKSAPALGRGFVPAHEEAGNDQVVLLSHEAWQRHFGADPRIVGRRVTFGRETREVIGVMPEGFTYPVGPARATEAWIPHVPRATDRDHGFPGRGYYLQVVGRLRPSASLELARAQVAAATDAVIAAHPTQTFWKDARPVVTSLHDYVVGPPGRWLLLVLGAVGLVLLIAYVNVANLLLARATVRARELALRAALGASRARTTRMLLAESLLLSGSAALLGIVLAWWGLSLVTASLPDGLARASAIALDLRVLGVAIAASLLTGLVFGVVPAWYGSHADVISVIKEGGAAVGASRERGRWQRVLLVAELAFVVTLLVATGLFVVSFVNVLRADLGFERGNLVGVSVSRSFSTIDAAERGPAAEAFVREVLERAKAVPGVRAAAFVDGGLPLFGMMASYSITVDGYGSTEGADMVVLKEVTPDFFNVAGIPFVAGRAFDGTERQGTPHVAILNDEAARRFFQGRDPVGEVFTFRGPTRVIGVVKSVRLTGPEEALRPEMYLPILQDDTGGQSISGDVIVRVSGETAGAVAALLEALRPFAPPTRPPQARDVDQRFRDLTASRRFSAGLMAAFGLLALVMAAAGVYGLTSFLVAQQSRALGLRVALGATRGRIFRGVVKDAGLLLTIGATLGLAGGWAASRAFRSVVFGLTGGESWLYLAVAALVAATCLAAALLPARRASRVDPLVGLRSE
jgi:predicted permease